MSAELDSKEVAFNKILQWLEEYGFRIDRTARNDSINTLTQFEAKIYPPREDRRFFLVIFSNKFKDSFTIQTAITLSEEDQMTIGKGLRKREQDQVYIDIFRLVFAQHLNCDARFPTVDIQKLIFIDSLRDKQFLFDSVFDLMHSMLLVESRFSELINQFYPKGEE